MALLGNVEPDVADRISEWLNNGDNFQIVDAAEMASRFEREDLSEVVVHVSDKYWTRIGEAGDRISLTATKPRNGVPTVEIVFPGDTPLKKYLRKCRTEVVGIEVEVGNLKWAAIVDTASYKLEDGVKTLTVKCFGIYEILSYLLIWPNWLLPIQVQVPSKAWFVGPVCTVVESMIAEQALRIQSGMWELVNNAFSLNLDWRSWFGRWLTSNGDILTMLTTPIYVVHHNPLLDGSPWVSGVFRMDPVGAAIDKLITAYGVSIDVELWRPGDPQPDAWSNLKVPTYVVRVTDRSAITGPTSTLLDGLLFQVVNVLGSALGEAVAPLIQQPQGRSGVFISQILGMRAETPWPVLIDHPNGPMESFEIVDHHPQAYQLVIGGRSPKWLNDIMNAFFSWLIDSLMIIIGLTGVPSNLLDGFLNDAALAFQMMQLFDRRVEMGPYATRIEKLLATGAAPYNVDAIFTLITFAWDTRGYRSAQATFRNGYPYWVGRDVFVGGLMPIVDDEGWMLIDYVENVMLRQTRLEDAEVMVQIGDGKAEQAPIVKSQRFITGLMEVANTILLTPNSG
ncbi:hypothetical protein SAMN04488581_2600 [Mycolicibacterium neoaurum]|uniref:Gp37-like protein n=1 Tax=Mycolicibacterium neoaurum TaxID=1795 RepID=UPI000690CD2D|nr:hypothetical protein [Mycolicibacterium neoaurum]SDD58603.1 hypothetical protein SAMN04488581_2600 [Mycolicibacterium neoaurum]